MQRRRATTLLGYMALLLAVVVGLVLLSALVGDRASLGRIVWLGVGLFLGALWALRSRLPVLSAADPRIAAGGWLALILTSVVTATVAPTSLSLAMLGVPPRTATAQGQQSVLKPAPPTAARRTGTVGPTAEPGAARATPGSAVGPTAGRTPSPSASPGQTVARAAPSPSRTPTPAQPAVTPTSPLPDTFDPHSYLGQGNAYDCADLSSQAEAQAILRADPTDPNVIDNNQDGIACEANPPPRDSRRVSRPGR